MGGAVVGIAVVAVILYPDETNAIVDFVAGDQADPDPEAAGRAAYEEEVKGLAEQAEALLKNGVSEETVAEKMVEERNAIKTKYRQFMDVDRVKVVEARNLGLYGDVLGPSYEQLREDYSPREIIEKAARPGGHDLGY